MTQYARIEAWTQAVMGVVVVLLTAARWSFWLAATVLVLKIAGRV